MLTRSQVQYVIRDPTEPDPSSRLRGALIRINLGRDAGGYTIAEIMEVIGWRDPAAAQLRLLEAGIERISNVEGVSNSLPTYREFERYGDYLGAAGRVITDDFVGIVSHNLRERFIPPPETAEPLPGGVPLAAPALQRVQPPQRELSPRRHYVAPPHQQAAIPQYAPAAVWDVHRAAVATPEPPRAYGGYAQGPPAQGPPPRVEVGGALNGRLQEPPRGKVVRSAAPAAGPACAAAACDAAAASSGGRESRGCFVPTPRVALL